MDLKPQLVDSDSFETISKFERIWLTGIPKAVIISVILALGVCALIWFLI